MSVRKVSHHGKHIIGHFPSLKLQRMVAFESLLERDFICLLDYEAEVTWFAEQPLVITYTHEGREHRYTPDVQVSYQGRSLLFECKPAALVHTPENQRKFAAAQAWCETQGWTFHLMTEAHLATNWRLRNIQHLTQFARYTIAPEFKGRIRTYLATLPGPVSVASVLAAINPQAPQTGLIALWHMAFHHELYLPLNPAALTEATPVSLRSTTTDEGWLP